MNYYVADTHALYWYLINSPLLGAGASAAFDEADNGNALIYIPSIVLAELYFLNKNSAERLILPLNSLVSKTARNLSTSVLPPKMFWILPPMTQFPKCTTALFAASPVVFSPLA